MTLKIAVSGKGGVGKSTVAAALALLLAKRGETVLALDADPDANLASALGVTHAEQAKIAPVSAQLDLIEERTDAKLNEYGRVFKLNPYVSDIAEKLGYRHNGITLLVLGAVRTGGGGCACPESTFARALVSDLVLYKNETLIMDMEAGVEHLGRATATGVDLLIVVAEPGQRSIDCANSVLRLAGEIGVRNVALVANKLYSPEDEAFIREALPSLPYVGAIPYSSALRNADRDGVSVLDTGDAAVNMAFERILEEIKA